MEIRSSSWANDADSIELYRELVCVLLHVCCLYVRYIILLFDWQLHEAVYISLFIFYSLSFICLIQWNKLTAVACTTVTVWLGWEGERRRTEECRAESIKLIHFAKESPNQD